MWILYQLAMAGTLLLAGPFLLARRGRHYLATLAGRWGRQPPGALPAALWIHAVSVGEVGVAVTLARALPAPLELVLTTITPTGQERARATLGKRAQITYLPFDLAGPIRRFFATYRPRALVLVEGDLWPLLLNLARRRGIEPIVVNGRISDRSFRRMRRLRALVGPLLAPVDRFGVQTEEDRNRLLELGVPPERVVTTGNLKFDTPEPVSRPEVEQAILALAAGRAVVVAGSTMAGEEERVLRAHRRAGGGKRSLLVLAPRHPERWPRVAELLAASGLSVALRSRLAPGGPGAAAASPGRPDVLLLDSLGELAALYRVADVAFVGGTLVDTGGHNPLEAARFGVPVAVGPSMENFREIAEAFDAARAWGRAADADALGDLVERWLRDPEEARRVGEAGRALIAANRGALERTLRLLEPTLAALEAGR